ncbi:MULTISPECIES: ISL3 family transposase [Janibacter]|uniref:Transposase n=1 Tax=Janibacter indicus TaxID=857417 RepID=A0A1W2A8F2_9MICO|nr:ISL3 family transposase [Janibacter indicus]SMC56711.1 Transposase [Janibacter indicus]
MPEPTLCCRVRGGYCDRCDVLVGLPGLHVIAVEQHGDDRLVVTVESAPEPMGCRSCGVIARGHGRVEVRLVDAPAFGRPVRIIWRKRRWLCLEPACGVGSFVEQDDAVATPRGLLTARACRWAIEQIRREHASVNGVRRQLGTGWRTVWESIRPLLQAAADDVSRFEGVAILGVDEHVWHHVSTKPIEDGGRGPKELTGMVDLTRDAGGRTRARLLDLVPGRSGAVYKDWLDQRGQAFRARVEVATLDPFHGYKNAIDDQLEDARSVLDAFHVVKLATAVVDDVRRRVQQQIHGHRGRKNDPLYRIRNILRAGAENLTERQRARLEAAWAADERHLEVEVAWVCAQQVRSAYHQATHAAGRAVAEKILDTFASCPIPEVARLGKTLNTWRREFLGYFDTNGANNGGTEAINGLIELHRRVARGFRNRDNYRLRMLLIGGGLNLRPHTHR